MGGVMADKIHALDCHLQSLWTIMGKPRSVPGFVAGNIWEALSLGSSVMEWVLEEHPSFQSWLKPAANWEAILLANTKAKPGLQDILTEHYKAIESLL
jgi:hypothetical protein